MTRFISLLLLGLATSSAQAADGEPQAVHPSLYASVTGLHSVVERVDMRATISTFWGPPSQPTLYGYVGPQFSFAKGAFKLAPQIGLIANATGQGELAPLVSLWVFADPVPKLHFFLEGDVNLKEKTDYYGLYVVSYDVKPKFSLGVQAEQIDLDLAVGPHLGFVPSDPLYLEVDWFSGVTPESLGSHGVRLVVGLTY